MSDSDSQGTSGAQDPATGIVIPEELRTKYPQIIDMILASESMNDEERQYWVEILPVMSPEQVEQLQKILQNERDQLAEIDSKYGKQIEEIEAQKRPLEEMGAERQARASERTAQEETARAQEEQAAADLLNKIDE